MIPLTLLFLAQKRNLLIPLELSRRNLLIPLVVLCTKASLGPDSHHPIISLSGIPSAVMVLRILHPILASTLCAANPLARIAEPTIAL